MQIRAAELSAHCLLIKSMSSQSLFTSAFVFAFSVSQFILLLQGRVSANTRLGMKKFCSCFGSTIADMFPWSYQIITSQFIFMTNPCRTANWVWVCVMFCVSDDLCSCGCVNCGNIFSGKYSHIYLNWLLGLKLCILLRTTMGLVWGLCWDRHSGVMSACRPRQTVLSSLFHQNQHKIRSQWVICASTQMTKMNHNLRLVPALLKVSLLLYLRMCVRAIRTDRAKLLQSMIAAVPLCESVLLVELLMFLLASVVFQ